MEMDRNTLQHTDVGLPTGNMFEQVRSKIMTVRETVVILDADIADLYGVETKRVNEAVKNNPDKFPSTYMFRLTREEMIFLRSKNPTAKISSKSRVLPAVFTERIVYVGYYIEKQEGCECDVCYNRNICQCTSTETGTSYFASGNRQPRTAI